MMHGVTLITTIAAGFGLALILGFVAVRLGLPALIGYLLAGVVLGPATPGYVADLEIAGQLAEIGVMLLMFGVGLHFSFQDLLSVRRIALPGRNRADRGRHGTRRGPRDALGLESVVGHRVRLCLVGREHGRAAARAGERAASSRP